MAIQKAVKCPGCEESFHREGLVEGEDFVYIKKRYWHKKCYEKTLSTITEDQEIVKELEAYICQVFQIDYVHAKIRRQINDMIAKYGYSYSGILGTLRYWFEIKRNPVDAAKGGIGIVPYVYEDAKRYFQNLFQAQERNRDTELDSAVSAIITIKIHSPIPKRKQVKAFDLGFLEKERTN